MQLDFLVGVLYVVRPRSICMFMFIFKICNSGLHPHGLTILGAPPAHKVDTLATESAET